MNRMITTDDESVANGDALTPGLMRTVENEDTRRLLGIRRKQSKAHWIQRIASKRLGLSYQGLLRWDGILKGRRSSEVLKRSMQKSKFPKELRWAIAYRIRYGNATFDRGLAKSLALSAGVPIEDVSVYTVTTEDMFKDEATEDAWMRSSSPTVSWEPNEDFTGNIDVIVDMEDSVFDDSGPNDDDMVLDVPDDDADIEMVTDGDDSGHAPKPVIIEAVEHTDDGNSFVVCVLESPHVASMLDFLAKTGACRVFNEVDGRSARYRWTDDHWEAIKYPVITSMYEREEQALKLDRIAMNETNGMTECNVHDLVINDRGHDGK